MNRIKLALLFLTFFNFLFLNYMEADAQVPNDPSDVYVNRSNNSLVVHKPGSTAQTFVIKGVSWSPATKAPSQGPNPFNPNELVQYGFFFDWDGRNPQGHEVLLYWLKNQLSQYYSTDIPLIKQMNANTIRIYHSLGSTVENYDNVAIAIKKVLDECYRNGIMVIMSVAMSEVDLESQKYLQVVNAYKNHPAILMWSIGNEWNFNFFYGSWTLDEAAQSVNLAAEKIKEIDPHHPVSSVIGDAFYYNPASPGGCPPPTLWMIKDVLLRCPNIDIWGLNVYRGSSFTDLFTQWGEQWLSINQLAKPFYISEFGIDSFYTTQYSPSETCSNKAVNVVGYSSEETQADIDAKLWREIKEHLSSQFSDEFCLGGLIHEFNDELWKVGNYNVGLGGIVDYNASPDNHCYDDYNKEGFILVGSSPDNVLNEEFFGLVNADRKPKLAYEKIKIEWLNTLPFGHFDVADATQIGGWAIDPDVPQTSIDVHFYRDGPAGQGVWLGATTANTERTDVCNAIGSQYKVGDSCPHGFSVPTYPVLLDGKTHAVYAYAIDTSGGTNPQISNSPKTITIPAAPSNLTAIGVYPTQVNLSWTDNSDNEDGFNIERKTGISGTYSQIAMVNANITNYYDLGSYTGVAPNTTYYYRVRAYNASGNSNYSNEANATTPALIKPDAPSNLVATVVSTSQINLTWTDNATNEYRFKIERGIESRRTKTIQYTQIATVGANTTNFTDTGLRKGSTYYYRVRAYNSAGNSGYSNTASATTLRR